MSKPWILATTVLSVCLLCASASAQGRSQGRGKPDKNDKTAAPAVAVSAVVIFGERDRTTFSNYFTTHKIVAQPLPPGIAKNVARGKPLPPGIAKKALPADLIVLAPRVDRDVSFAIVGNVVVAIRRGVVIDVMVGVFR